VNAILAQVASLTDKARKLEQENDALAMERDVLARERDTAKAALAKARTRSSYAVLPNRSPNGTWRRPIVIECSNGSAMLQPHGPTFTLHDLTSLSTIRANPLVRAVVHELVRVQGKAAPDGTAAIPYIFFVIRPDGIRPYYAARTVLEPLGIAFGYELVDREMALDFPDLDNPEEWDGSPPTHSPSLLASRAGDRAGGNGNGGGQAADGGEFRWPAIPAAPAGEGGMLPGQGEGSGGGSGFNREDLGGLGGGPYGTGGSDASGFGQGSSGAQGSSLDGFGTGRSASGPAGRDPRTGGGGFAGRGATGFGSGPGGMIGSGASGSGIDGLGGSEGGRQGMGDQSPLRGAPGSATAGGAGDGGGLGGDPPRELPRFWPATNSGNTPGMLPPTTGTGGTISRPRSGSSTGNEGFGPATGSNRDAGLSGPGGQPGQRFATSGNRPAGAGSQTGTGAYPGSASGVPGARAPFSPNGTPGDVADALSQAPDPAHPGRREIALQEPASPFDSDEQADLFGDNTQSGGGGGGQSQSRGAFGSAGGSGASGRSSSGGQPGISGGSPSGSSNGGSGLNVGTAGNPSAAGSSASDSSGDPQKTPPPPVRRRKRDSDLLKVDVPMEIVVACRPDGVVIYPGGYRISPKSLKGKDDVLAKSLKGVVDLRKQVDPLIRPQPTVRYLIEPGGETSYQDARRQTMFSGLDWPTVLQVADTQVLDPSPRERF
jgi:hypothetical protein